MTQFRLSTKHFTETISKSARDKERERERDLYENRKNADNKV